MRLPQADVPFQGRKAGRRLRSFVVPTWLAVKVKRNKQVLVCVGDMITYLNVWRGWRDHNKNPQWAFRHFVNHKALLRAEDIRVQLRATLKSLGEPLASCGDDPQPICKVCQYALGCWPSLSARLQTLKSLL